VPYHVLGYRLQAVVAGKQVILPPQHLLQLLFLLGVQVGILDQAVDVVVQVGVDQLQLGRAVLVEQRHRRAVLHRLLEVVNRYIIAEDLLGALLPAMSGVPVKARNIALGSAARMLSANVSYWLRCASSVSTITSERSVSISGVWNLCTSVNT
jgi:hypothetical protein